MKTFYFTWASNHPLGGYVQRIDAPDEASARRAMCRRYGQKWCACYPLSPDTYEVGDKSVRAGGDVRFIRLDAVIIADGCADDCDYILFRLHKRNRPCAERGGKRTTARSET